MYDAVKKASKGKYFNIIYDNLRPQWKRVSALHQLAVDSKESFLAVSLLFESGMPLKEEEIVR